MMSHRLKSAFEEGVFRLSWSLERYQSLVHIGDVAGVAAIVLADSERHSGATYELVAPGRYTAYDLATTISVVTGRDIAVEQISPDRFLKGLLVDEEGFEYRARLARAISARYSSHDFVGNPNVLTWLLGRSPTTFAQFVQAQYQAYQRADATPRSR
jgi:uncharacterized protein YbjT (DUF2867 family)